MAEFLFENKVRKEVVGIRLSETEKAEVIKIGKKQGLKSLALGTICGALVRYALQKIREESK